MTPTEVLRWKDFIEERERGIAELSEKIASRAYLSTLFSAAKKTPEKMPQPSAKIVKKLALELNIPIGVMMGEEPHITLAPSPGYQRELYRESSRIYSDVLNMVHTRMSERGHRPGVEDVLGWWRRTDGRLSDSGNIGEAFDLIEIPHSDSQKVTPHRVGENSMAGTFFKEDRRARLQKVVDTMSEQGQASLATSYRAASLSQGPIFSQPLSLLIAPTDNEAFEINYLRMQLCVTSSDGTPFIASYCFPI